MIRNIYHVTFTTALILLSGCYNIEREVIPASLGIKTPFAYDSLIFDQGGTADLSHDPYNNDYRFRTVFDDGKEIDTGTFRAMHIRDDIYVLQVKYDDEPDYYLVFYKITSERVDPMEPDDYSAVDALAEKHNVTVDYDYTTFIGGNAENILAFLKDHRQLSFKPAETF